MYNAVPDEIRENSTFAINLRILYAILSETE